jgi:MFS transporter, putative metabolite transport protein
VSIDAPAAQVSAPPRSQTPARSIQAYIDETPVWSDGTPLQWVPMTAMQWRIWMLAAAGKFFEGLVVFMTGVAMPLIAEEFGLTRTQHGIVSAASLFGILIGAIGLGGLSDRFGRRVMFIVEMIIFIIFLVLLVASPGYYLLVLFPTQARGRLVLAAFGFQALGALTGTIVGYLVLKNIPEVGAWRWMYATAIIPAVLVTIGRFSITESAHWLLVRGRDEDARVQVTRLLARLPPHPKIVELATTTLVQSRRSVLALFEKANRRATILASVPWFLQDLGTYGIGMFTPTILAASIGHKAIHVRNVAELLGNEELAAKGAALIDVLLIVGIVVAIALVDRIGSIRLQVWGFIGCAAGLLIAAASTFSTGTTATLLIFAGFMLFNFMTNLGPNAQTYLLAGEVFPTHVRGTGAGFAAAFAKIGAVTTAFLFPMLLADIGTRTLLLILAGTSVLGAFITFAFRIETTGVSLEQIGAAPNAATNARAPAGPPRPTKASPSPAEETAT